MTDQIESTGTGISHWLLAVLLIASAPALLLAKGPPGGGGKVSVTLATPADAFQGEELDVLIDGSGFDAGSTATWFITGTSDDSQVQVLSNEYLPSTGQLKARIRVNGNASVNGYDIEVQNSSGRRGKGTTLFRVKASAESCIRDADPEFPAIAYLRSDNEAHRFSIYLASSDGCDQVALYENEPAVVGVQHVRLAFEGPAGVVIHTEVAATIDTNRTLIWATPIVIDGFGLEILQAELLEDVDGYVGGIDVHKYPDGSVSVLFDVLYNEEPRPRNLVLISNLDPLNLSAGGLRDERLGSCLLQDQSGNCLAQKSLGDRLKFSADGTEAYFSYYPSSLSQAVLGTIETSPTELGPADILATFDQAPVVRGLSTDDSILAYRHWVRSKKNQIVATQLRMLSLSTCQLSGCSLEDGVVVESSLNSNAYTVLWLSASQLVWPGALQGNGTIHSIERYSFTDGNYLSPMALRSDFVNDMDTR